MIGACMNLLEQRIRAALEEKGISFEVIEHAPVYTNPEMAERLGVGQEFTVKNLVLKTREGEFALLLLPGNKRFDTKEVAAALGTKSVSLAKPEEVLNLIGCEIGCVPPFGHAKPLVILMDPGLLLYEYLYFNPGSHSKSFKIPSKHLPELCNPIMLKEETHRKNS